MSDALIDVIDRTTIIKAASALGMKPRHFAQTLGVRWSEVEIHPRTLYRCRRAADAVETARWYDRHLAPPHPEQGWQAIWRDTDLVAEAWREWTRAGRPADAA